MWDEIGRGRIERRIMELAAYARDRLAASFGTDRMYSPGADVRLASPLIAFHPFRRPEDAWNVKKFHAFVGRLEAEHRIWIRWTEFDVAGSPHQHYAARMTTHIFNSHEEIDRAIGIMVRLADEMS
jgi:selenocysteine lyase/cysteine desulfurase